MRHIVKTGVAVAALAIVGVQYLSHHLAPATATPPVPPAPRPAAQAAPPVQPSPVAAPPAQQAQNAPPMRSPQDSPQNFRRPAQN